YDAANRLTSAGDVTYTWDDRGNLVSDGTFTYLYNAAGRMVQAESVTVTLVYTYNANGLRVAQSVDGDATSFVWDWASGIPEMLSEGDNLYLVGHDTLGGWDGVTWAYHLPDALGSVRQVADGAGAGASTREWTPYGVELGVGQAGLGYTGEWWDADVGLLYLRARWYDGQVGRFTQRDVWEGDYLRPQSLHSYVYVQNNAVNLIDPSGLFCGWPPYISGSDCERFILELTSKILVGRLNGLSDYEIIRVLAEYYSGIKTTYTIEFGVDDWEVIIGGIPAPYNPPIPHPFFRLLPCPERWPISWKRPDEPPSLVELAVYGFKRQYWQNTHHYFADFYLAYEFGAAPEVVVNTAMEMYQYSHEGHPLIESVNDVRIGFVAVEHAKLVQEKGIEVLPGLLYEEMCIKRWRELLQEALLAQFL
ncbi:MAG: RHS repeat-associated core domain-containing protein, partial [Chloroflexota bacterium]|nr:RHS repeat-associated core domain-containing protein [Chloroflexota bacterium]